MKKGQKICIAIVAIVLVVGALVGAYFFYGPKTMAGSKHYTLEVVGKDGQSTSYKGATDQEYLRGALEELAQATSFSMEGEDSAYGLYITTVNGETADYSVDASYWSIYVNGEYGMYGVDSQPVADQDAYKLVYEVYSE